MKVLVIGSGGREHAMAWKLAQSNLVTEVIVAPGNGGTRWNGSLNVAPCRSVNIKADDIDGLVKFAQTEQIGLTAVGPEISLSLGVVDAFQAHQLKIFGPTQAAAQLESSKAFSKTFMDEMSIPTAEFGTFTNKADAFDYLDSIDHLVVVKASGLASGKGVIVCDSADEAYDAVTEMLEDGSIVVVEDKKLE